MKINVAKYNVCTSAMRCQMPITTINTIGEILEHLALKQLLRYLECSPNVDHMKSAYRAIHSIENAMTKLVIDLLTAAYSKSVLLSLDIIAAFDTLDQRRLLRSNELFGSDVSVLGWLQSYLTRH